MTDKCLISVVIPCLNEARSLGLCVERARRALKELGREGEVVVADNGSTDGSERVAQQAGARVVRAAARGYGAALIEGFQSAHGGILVMGDADDSYHFDEIAPFVNKIEAGYDLVIGNRFRGRIEAGAMPPLHRYLGTPVLSRLAGFFFKTRIGDVNCGMRALTKEAFNRMQLKVEGMEFATEMIVKAALCKLKIAEIPCNLYRDRRGRKPHLNTWPDGWRHLRFMLLFRPDWVFIVPGLCLAAAGLAGLAALVLRDVFSPGLWLPVVTQNHMLSFMLLFLLGAQITGLGLAAEVFSFSRHFDAEKKSIIFLQRHFTLERGLLGGLALIGAGALGLLYLLVSYLGLWPSLSLLLRFDLAVCAITSLTFGVQLVYSSFLLSLFYLKIK
ncbi:MAG: glycosyltransferase family 2 protein [Candidatus Saganbacteria bacterium]|nr:glycosyltransferase family 2 protein [Candidatus Saganbacteria bacterium]